MRARRLEKERARYPTAVVRVLFPSKIMVQATFLSSEPLRAVIEALRPHLLNPDKSDFYLFTTPPRRVLGDLDRSLADYHLAPSAVVRFGCDGAGSAEALLSEAARERAVAVDASASKRRRLRESGGTASRMGKEVTAAAAATTSKPALSATQAAEMRQKREQKLLSMMMRRK